MTSQTTIPVGIYWKPGVWDLARSAYIADLDTDADSPGSFVGWLAQALERDPAVEVIIGVSPDDPTCELERTEYVRVGTQHALLRRIVRAAQIDTVVDSRLIVDSTTASARCWTRRR